MIRKIEYSLRKESDFSPAMNKDREWWCQVRQDEVNELLTRRQEDDRDSLADTVEFYLTWAAGFSQPDMVELLIRRWGGEVQCLYGNSPVHWAAAYNGPEMLKTLIDLGADINMQSNDGHNALSCAAAYHSDIQVVQWLLNAGGNVNNISMSGHRPLHYGAMYHPDPDIIDLLSGDPVDLDVRDHRGQTPLFLAVRENNVVAVDRLLSRGADIHVSNSPRQTLMHMAALVSGQDMMRRLIGLNLDINASDREGMSPLHQAALNHSDIGVIQLMLAQGADVHARDRWGNTPLHFACRRSNVRPDVLELLVSAGADIDSVNQWGKTPLFGVFEMRQLAGIQSMLGMGADPMAKDNKGLAAVDLLKSEAYRDNIRSSDRERVENEIGEIMDWLDSSGPSFGCPDCH